jgi:hypothetical protein
MRNRLHAKLLTLSVFLSLAFSGLYLQAQTASPFFFQVNPADNVFILDQNCQAVFNPVIDTFYSTLNPPANIVYPPTGVNAALTGYSVGQTVNGPQIVNVAFVIGDDQGNVDTFFFQVEYLDSTLPTFTTSKPADITINCMSQFPDPLTRPATDNCAGMMSITSVDNPLPPPAVCGAPFVVTRTWTATDPSGNTALQTQIITILPDNSPPVIQQAPQDAVSFCGKTDYPDWLANQLGAVSSGTVDNCGPLMFSYIGPATFPDTCELSVNVIFTVVDACGLFDTISATFTALDTIAPVLIGVPADTTISCLDSIPAPPNVLASDNCAAIGPNADFTEVSTQTMGEGCTDYSYTITRTWTAMDSCGNVTTRQQVISIVDDLPPSFTTPPDTSVVCGMASLPANTGEPADLADNCSPEIGFSYTDLIDSLSCPQEQTIRRVWTVVDECGNAAVDTQYIYVVDTLPPTFTPPADTVYVSCNEAGDLSITGMPTDIVDECDSEPIAEFEQEIFDILCPNSYTIRRIWYVSDACGNADSTQQIIIVQDTLAPNFTIPAMDMSISCTTAGDAEAAFNAWVNDLGAAEAEDNCPGDNVVFFAYITGSTLNPFLPPPSCPDTIPGVFRKQTVDFVAIDACGNEAISTATFTMLDQEPPLIVYCPGDTIVTSDSGLCVANLNLPPPLASELCGLDPASYSFSQTLPITSPAPPGQELDTLIDDLVFTFAVPPAPAQALGVVNLRIDLNNADADGPYEYLLIYAEDGTLIGQTANTPAQCDSSTTIISIPDQDFNLWAQDGIVSFTLKANIPPNNLPGRFSVNNICPGGTVDALLFFEGDTPLNMRFEYSLNDGPRQPGSFDMPVSEQFELGTTQIAYYVIDCAGNESVCTFQVSVQDEEAPSLDCPAGFTIDTDPGSCQAMIQLPVLAGLQDNCSVGDVISQTVPADSASALLTFSYSPDLMDWLADNKPLSFTGLSPIALGDVTLVVEILGDVDGSNEFFTILNPDGNSIGTTQSGQPNVQAGDCDNPSFTTFTFSAAEFNAWAAAGTANFLAVSNINIPIPPGGPGDGVNPCNPTAVIMDGDVDSVSYLRATLSYVTLAPSFSASGATILPSEVLTDITDPPTIALNKGVTTISYEATDSYGNMGLCSFDVEVLDQEAPVALCQTTIVYIDPSGTVVDTISPQEIDMGSYDNCEIASLSVFPNLITCNAIGDTLTVFLTATDLAGNSSVCQALIRVEGEPPVLNYTTGSCGGDTLFLFATPPSPGNVFTYQWTGPNFSSSQQNPFIPNATQVNAGTYKLVIQGLTGCKSEAEIQVTIEDLPLIPTLSFASDSICTGDNIVLNTSAVQAGGSVSYRWYSGVAPGGTLVATTATPSLTLPGPHAAGDSCYYVVVIRNACESFPSVSKCVHITQPPTALVNNDVITLCEGESFQLGTPVSGPGITYLWEGPGFSSTLQIPPPVNNASSFNAGIYTLTVFRNGCASAPAFTIVNVLARPNTPVIFNPTSMSNPACQGDTITLTTNAGGVTSYQWTSPQFETFVTTVPSLTIENTSIQNHQGNWTLVVNDGFCPSNPSNPIFLHIAPLPNVNATSNSPVCSNLNLQLSANFLAGASYTWTAPGGASYAGQNQTLPPVAGTYTVSVISSLGCQNSSSVNVVVNQAPSITSISNNAIDCPAGPTNVTLTATFMPAYNGSNYSFAWTGGPGGNFMSTTFPGVIPNATSANNGPYTLVVTDMNGCKSSAATTVVSMGAILPTPTQPTFAGNMPFCEGQSVVLNTIDQFSGSVEIYKWHLPGGGVITTAGPSLQLNNLNPLTDNGNYFVVVEVDGCESDPSPISVLTINPTPQITASNNGPVCEGDPLELHHYLFHRQCAVRLVQGAQLQFRALQSGNT